MLATNLNTLRSLLKSDQAEIQIRGKMLTTLALDTSLDLEDEETMQLLEFLDTHGRSDKVVTLPREVAERLDPDFQPPVIDQQPPESTDEPD